MNYVDITLAFRKGDTTDKSKDLLVSCLISQKCLKWSKNNFKLSLTSFRKNTQNNFLKITEAGCSMVNKGSKLSSKATFQIDTK